MSNYTYQIGCPGAVLNDTACRTPVPFELREVPFELISEGLRVGYGASCSGAADTVFGKMVITSLATPDDVDARVQSM